MSIFCKPASNSYLLLIVASRLFDKRAGLADLYKVYAAVKEVEKMVEMFRQSATSDNDILNENFGVPFVKKVDKMANFQVVTLFKLT